MDGRTKAQEEEKEKRMEDVRGTLRDIFITSLLVCKEKIFGKIFWYVQSISYVCNERHNSERQEPASIVWQAFFCLSPHIRFPSRGCPVIGTRLL